MGGYMKGLDLARRYYEEYGKKMLEEEFPETLAFLAVGLVGSGSECYGFDDEISRDHDFTRGFAVWLTDADEENLLTCLIAKKAAGCRTVARVRNPVYTGDLILLKTEVVNHKTGQSATVPDDRRVVIPNAHEPIISQEIFEQAAKIRAEHHCPARMGRENLFRGLLFCDCCGHPLTLSRKKLKDREVDIYICTHHNRRPDECPKTHIIYHEVLYPYVLDQIRVLARSMKRRRVNSPICQYADIQELTPQILQEVVMKLLVGHMPYKTKPGKVVRIQWRFN